MASTIDVLSKFQNSYEGLVLPQNRFITCLLRIKLGFCRCSGDVDAGSNSHSHYTQLNTRSKSQWDTHYTANDVLVDTSRSAKTSTQFLYFLITIHCMFSHNRYVLLRNHQLSKKKNDCKQ